MAGYSNAFMAYAQDPSTPTDYVVPGSGWMGTNLGGQSFGTTPAQAAAMPQQDPNTFLGMGAQGWGNVISGANVGLQGLAAYKNWQQAQQQWDETADLRAAQLAGLQTETDALQQQVEHRQRNVDVARGLA